MHARDRFPVEFKLYDGDVILTVTKFSSHGKVDVTCFDPAGELRIPVEELIDPYTICVWLPYTIEPTGARISTISTTQAASCTYMGSFSVLVSRRVKR